MRVQPAAATTPEAIPALTEQERIRGLRWFARSGLIERDDVREMLVWENSGFSLDAAVRVAANDRAGLERLRRPCVRLLYVRFIEYCCRSRPKRRCLFLADSRPSATNGRRQLSVLVRARADSPYRQEPIHCCR